MPYTFTLDEMSKTAAVSVQTAGFKREVCIGQLDFDEKGANLPEQPTVEGIQ
jgi:hypothetical protein